MDLPNYMTLELEHLFADNTNLKNKNWILIWCFGAINLSQTAPLEGAVPAQYFPHKKIECKLVQINTSTKVQYCLV